MGLTSLFFRKKREKTMRGTMYAVIVVALAMPLSAAASDAQTSATVIRGEKMNPADIGAGVIETWEEVKARELTMGDRTFVNPRERNGAQGSWVVPTPRTSYYPNSGVHYVTNKWGDTSMGIGFPDVVDVLGVYVAGQGGNGVWTTGLRVIGYRNGEEVNHTRWFYHVDDEPTWFEINLEGVDRIVFESQAVYNGGGWYALDDLTFERPAAAGKSELEEVVVDFEDCAYGQKLTGSDYAGLTWESGTGDLQDERGVPAPIDTSVPFEAEAVPSQEDEFFGPRAGAGTAPSIHDEFVGVDMNYYGGGTFPPDTCGAIGALHYCEIVNNAFAVYDKNTGAQLSITSLNSFFNFGGGDPRILWDQNTNRWIAIASDFSTKIYFAISLSHNPMGSWFKTDFVAATGSDSGTFPDYPTLGVDANGIYISAFMAFNGQTVWSIIKAPLIDPTPTFPTPTVWRGLSGDTIQPCHTYGDSGGAYLVARSGNSAIRLRQITGSLAFPQLDDLGNVSVPYNIEPSEAPALGSTVDVDTVGGRLMNALYRDGFIWTAHAINMSGRAACRWYQINTSPNFLADSGTVSDPTLHYYFPSITVNSQGDAVMGFSGSYAESGGGSPGQYIATYAAGRVSTDPAGEMSDPILLQQGLASYTRTDGYGRNRWGDYSLTTLDPVDELTFWTIQAYGKYTNKWGTWMAELGYDSTAPDPDPMTFALLPAGVSVSEIEMRATTATDAESPPVSYFFEFVDVQVPGGHDSGWQENDPTYTDSGLFTNYLYGYTARAQDAASNETAPSATFTAATLIETPQSTPIVLTAATSATVLTNESFTNLTLNQSGLYFDSTTAGGDGGINEWIQDTSDQATGLTPDTLYTFRFMARNQDGVETDWSPEQTRRTKAAVPSAPVLSNQTCESIDVAIGDDINPSYTTYAIMVTATDPVDAGWDGLYVDISGNPTIDAVYQTQADWGTITITGLAEQTTYTFAVEAQNGIGITTDLGPEASLMTDPCSAIQCADLPNPSVCKGDTDGDGAVTPSDVGLVKFWYGNTDPANLCYFDVNCDGEIDAADVGLVKFYYGACTAESEPPCWAP
jgi:hypothetical protein